MKAQNLPWTIINSGAVQSANSVGINLQKRQRATNTAPGNHQPKYAW